MAGRVNTLEGKLVGWMIDTPNLIFDIYLMAEEKSSQTDSYDETKDREEKSSYLSSQGTKKPDILKIIRYNFPGDSNKFVEISKDIAKDENKEKRIRVKHLISRSSVFLQGIGKIEMIEK